MSAEIGAIRKSPGLPLNVALVYPNSYHVGMSNLGVHAIYHLLNSHPSICCERFFLDQETSVESGRRLNEFNIVAFSISYELDWINVIRILRRNQIPVRSSERRGVPIVMAGGAAVTLNPEPMAEALDLCFLGDGETMVEPLYSAFEDAADYDDFLDRLKGRPGFYIPARCYPEYDGDQIRSFQGQRPSIAVKDPLDDPARTRIITDNTAFKDMFLIEIARGCYFKCKFCTARSIYHPFRPVNVTHLLPALDEAKESGLKLGLVSAALNSHPQAEELYAEILKRELRIAPPSLRSGKLSPTLIELIKISGVRGITLAPESGSDSLRKAQGKLVKNETLLNDIDTLVASGIRDIKLYFMIGLPHETMDDIEEICSLVERTQQLFVERSRGNRVIGKVAVSINTMVPKPQTEYERQPMLMPAEAKKRLRQIDKRLRKLPNTTVSHEGPQWAYRQGLIARGDRKILELLIRLADSQERDWQRIIREWDADKFVIHKLEQDLLPWDILQRPIL